MNLNNIQDLNDELEKAMINFAGFHDHMHNSRLFYKNSAFYERTAGDKPDKNNIYQNLLKVFADKNIEYTSNFPQIKVPTTGADPVQRQAASIREKIVYATHRDNGTALLHKKFAYDATIFSIAIAETTFDFKNRCVRIKRYNPRKVFWKLSNENERRVGAFWAVYAITAEEAEKTYGVRPKNDMISAHVRQKFNRAIDGQDWFTMAIRWDDKTRVKWVGDQFIEQPHNHMLGEIPIDLCAPLEDADDETHLPAFYLDPLIPLQAELNDSFYRRSRIVRRTSSPVLWVRGIPAGKRLDDVKAQMAQEGGGTIGLTGNGEAGLLQVSETKALNDHEDRIVVAMTRLSGFGNASFGESVGANTSGDALGMYFNATQRKIENQNIDWIAFYEGINAKILKYYDRLLKTGEQKQLASYSPAGTLMAIQDKDGTTKYETDRGGFDVSFSKDVIDGNYTTVVIPPSTTPKNAIEEKRLAIEAVSNKFMSRTTAYEMWGLLSPEDELALVKQEQMDPGLNPDGMQKMVAAMVQSNGGSPGGGGPSPVPAPAQIGGGGPPGV